jgi:hypothetical protein
VFVPRDSSGERGEKKEERKKRKAKKLKKKSSTKKLTMQGLNQTVGDGGEHDPRPLGSRPGSSSS